MVDSKFSLTFTLKQHTPLIHFQHDQAGATLRATELKPKLDRFIIANKGPNHKPWLKSTPNDDDQALEYKLTIRTIAPMAGLTPVKQMDDNRQFPNYFANMGSDKAKYKHLVLHRLVLIEVRSRHANLLEAIKKLLPDFLLRHNFGNRQSKGFGSFLLHPKDPSLPHNWLPSLDFYFDVDVSKAKDEWKRQERLFEVIRLFNAVLRSGINQVDRSGQPIFYFKSLLWLYLKGKGIRWDKKLIKQAFFPSKEKKHKSDHTDRNEKFDGNSPLFWESSISNNHILWRDVFGLSTDQAWYGGYKDKLTKESRDKNPKTGKPIYPRLQSPLFFKPMRTGEDSFRVLFEVPLQLKVQFKNGNKTPGTEGEIFEKTFDLKFEHSGKKPFKFPGKFDFDDFFKVVFRMNLTTHLDNSWHSNDDFLTLQRIFNQLSQQVNAKYPNS